MKILLKSSIIFLFVLINCKTEAQEAIVLFEQMVEKINSVNTLSVTMKTNERFGDKMREEKSFFKIQVSPLKIYFKQEYPLKEFQALYCEGENNNEVLFAPGGFPWVTFSMPPNGDRMRVSHHHPATHSGYTHSAKIFDHLLEKYAKSNPGYFVNEGLVKINGVVCQKVSFKNASFQKVDYKVLDGEDLHSIGEKLFVNDYMILEMNPQLDDYMDVKAGDIIKIPSDYAATMIIYIDKQLGVPRMIKTYDDKGLFEEYLYENIELTPTYSSHTFSKDNKEYGF